jgi:hypothetical protein
MAVIMTPANMLPIWPMAVKMAVRLAISSGLLRLNLATIFSLCWLRPRSKDVYGATVQTSFEETLEESNNTKLSVCLTGCGAHRQAGPNEQRERQPEAGRDFLDN